MKKQPKFLFLFFALVTLSILSTSYSWSEQTPAQAPSLDAKSGDTTSGISIEKAQQMAEVHLSLRNVRWGKPIEKTEEGSRWVFSYETPVPEQRVLGPRRVSVHKGSGLVRVRDK